MNATLFNPKGVAAQMTLTRLKHAKAALSAAEEFQPHLILLDLIMPGMDGGELAACFQANPKLKAVPIMFLTAAVTKGEVEAGGGRLGGTAIELSNRGATFGLLPLFARHERGEGWGEEKPHKNGPPLPRPSPPSEWKRGRRPLVVCFLRFLKCYDQSIGHS